MKEGGGEDSDDDLGGIKDMDDDDIDGIGKLGGGSLSEEQKLTKRMQRNRESARVSRLRKNAYVSGLEAEIAKLKAELAQAKQPLPAQEVSGNDSGDASSSAAPSPFAPSLYVHPEWATLIDACEPQALKALMLTSARTGVPITELMFLDATGGI